MIIDSLIIYASINICVFMEVFCILLGFLMSRINDTLVESLRPFTMDCAVTHTHRRDGHCVTELRCISQPDIVEEKTTCRVNDELPFPCKYIFPALLL